jgi:predicted RNA binding protein YcfA (HicA-like mRNA interferase family)
LLNKVLNNPKNVVFNDMSKLVKTFGFVLARVSGSHHIFTHPELNEIVNLQEVGGKAKTYQVKQFLALIEKYDLQMED